MALFPVGYSTSPSARRACSRPGPRGATAPSSGRHAPKLTRTARATGWPPARSPAAAGRQAATRRTPRRAARASARRGTPPPAAARARRAGCAAHRRRSSAPTASPARPSAPARRALRPAPATARRARELLKLAFQLRPLHAAPARRLDGTDDAVDVDHAHVADAVDAVEGEQPARRRLERAPVLHLERAVAVGGEEPAAVAQIDRGV